MVGDRDDLWRNFPKTAIEFERRFATEEACRAYWIEARWAAASRRAPAAVASACGLSAQTSLTSGTLLEKTTKPFKASVMRQS